MQTEVRLCCGVCFFVSNSPHVTSESEAKQEKQIKASYLPAVRVDIYSYPISHPVDTVMWGCTRAYSIHQLQTAAGRSLYFYTDCSVNNKSVLTNFYRTDLSKRL